MDDDDDWALHRIHSLEQFREVFSSHSTAWPLRIVMLQPHEAPELADCLRAIAHYPEWIVRNGRRVYGLALLDRKLMVVDGITIPRILRNKADGVTIPRLRQHADELLQLARRIGGSVVAPTEQLRDRLVELAATAEAWAGSDNESVFWGRYFEASSAIHRLRFNTTVVFDEQPDPIGPDFD
ncbi:hypothetical protein ACP70R_005908 [Stipagrostis hirtigluma subsp. patula]